MIVSLNLQCDKELVLGHCSLASHNVLLTNEWILLVKRRPSTMNMKSLKLNGMSFTGLLLTASSDDLEWLKEVSPMTLLEDISSHS
jgi:ATP adenylyltransferase/5',5'''-P-1,P-4-tetraphosphate phosphorylase II